jgi:hypothetical protein
MNLGFKIAGVLLVFLGELFAVLAETFGTKYQMFSSGFWRMILLITISGLFLVLGYYYGYKGFQNLWIITVVSLTTLLIVEPLIIFTIFGQTPTMGALIGFILGVIGLICAIIF